MEQESKNQNQNKEEPEQLKINMTRVGELLPGIIRQKTMGNRFRFNMTPQQAADMLAAEYASVVIKRCGVPIFDENTKNRVTELAKYITQEKPRFGVMFCGTCGNGKTTMLHALQSAIYNLGSKHFASFGPFFSTNMRIHDARDIACRGRDFEEIKRIRTYDLLAIDDLGKEPSEVMNFGTLINPIDHILEYRYEHQLFTAISTNLTSIEIKEKYGQRIADRFNEMLEVIVFQDVSYRG